MTRPDGSKVGVGIKLSGQEPDFLQLYALASQRFRWWAHVIISKADLDQDPLLKDRLISLSRIDGHSRWVSPAVLQKMTNLPEKVDGGTIVRDEQGNPTGIFVDNAMYLVPVPEWSEETMSRFFELTIKEAISYGLTSIHDADSKVNQINFFKK